MNNVTIIGSILLGLSSFGCKVSEGDQGNSSFMGTASKFNTYLCTVTGLPNVPRTFSNIVIDAHNVSRNSRKSTARVDVVGRGKVEVDATVYQTKGDSTQYRMNLTNVLAGDSTKTARKHLVIYFTTRDDGALATGITTKLLDENTGKEETYIGHDGFNCKSVSFPPMDMKKYPPGNNPMED